MVNGHRRPAVSLGCHPRAPLARHRGHTSINRPDQLDHGVLMDPRLWNRVVRTRLRLLVAIDQCTERGLQLARSIPRLLVL